MTRSGRTYTPQATLEAEAQLREQYDGPLFEGPIAVRVEYYADRQVITINELSDWNNESKLRGDLDNYLKVLDGLNKYAWNDDRQIKHLTGVLH
jgi:Holliday junction resolvase RusA-like endonuclease